MTTAALEQVAAGAGVATAELTRRFGRVTAVDRVSLQVPSGSVYGFLGPNGSGKTTTIRMLLGLVAPHSGEVELLGQRMPGRARHVLPRVGALIEGPAFHAYMSGRDNLRRQDACDATADPATRDRRIDDALHRVGLAAAARKKYRQYSLGMKQRLGLAAGLLQPRDLLILDEPTNGLDPQGTREVRHLVQSLAADGTTVLVSSHLLAEIEQVATHVGIMSAGRLIAQGPLSEVLGGSATSIVVTTPDPRRACEVMTRAGLEGVTVIEEPGGESARVSAQLGAHQPEDVNRLLVEDGVRVAGLGSLRPTLEDLFVSLTGEGFDVAH